MAVRACLRLADGANIAIGLPATGAERSDNGLTTVYGGAVSASAIAVEPTRDGLRALITIQNSMAPERYAFPISGDAARLVNTGDGSVVAYDSSMAPIAMLAPAWARDAGGRAVPSHYELDGTTVIQVVEHRAGGTVVVVLGGLFVWQALRDDGGGDHRPPGSGESLPGQP